MLESESISPAASNPGPAEFRSEKIRVPSRRKFFRVMAKFKYPNKTVPNLMVATGYPERTCYDWIGGKSDAPVTVWFRLISDIASSE